MIKRSAAAALALLTGTVLAGCGSDPAPQGNFRPTPGVECGGEKQLTAEGSSAQANAFAQFTSAFLAQCMENNIDYNPTGSGSGVEQFTAAQVDLGGTDSPLEPDEIGPADQRCGGNPALHLPLVFGPVAIAYNVDGVNDLVLSPQVAAKIFNGSITKWNDPAIAQLNPSTRLPDAEVNVVYRNDDSGTTDNFQKYLSAAAPQEWTQGDGKAFAGGVGEGKAKSHGVSDAVDSTPNSITYVESSFAENSRLGIARLDSGHGPVELNTASTKKAIAGAEVKSDRPNDMVLDMEKLYATKSPGTYPLVMVTYELVCSKGYEPGTAKAMKAFLQVAVGSGQDKLAETGYVPLPEEFRGKVKSVIDSMG